MEVELVIGIDERTILLFDPTYISMHNHNIMSVVFDYLTNNLRIIFYPFYWILFHDLPIQLPTDNIELRT